MRVRQRKQRVCVAFGHHGRNGTFKVVKAPVPYEAEVGAYVVHRVYKRTDNGQVVLDEDAGAKWRITHAPSGGVAIHSIRRKDVAVRAARRLARDVPQEFDALPFGAVSADGIRRIVGADVFLRARVAIAGVIEWVAAQEGS